MFDTSDGIPGPFVIGFVDPAEATGSDAEVEPIDPEPYVPVSKRWHRWRLYRDGYGKWVAEQPSQIDEPMFVTVHAGRHNRVTVRGYAFRDESRARVVDALALALAKHEAAL